MKNETYEQFVEKFKPKKTTDDCYTPQNVYDAVVRFVKDEYGIGERKIVRPFWPGGDYERFEYDDGCIVIDNPPFSILSKIIDFYMKKGIDFFLFAPSLTIFSTVGKRAGVNVILSDSTIIYENGAKVSTCFVTNMGEYKIHTSPSLFKLIDKENNQKVHKINYDYPDNIITPAKVQGLARNGQEIRIREKECVYIRKLDEQKELKKTIYGGGFIVSDRIAIIKRQLEVKAEEQKQKRKQKCSLKLSESEKQIVKTLNKIHKDH